MAIGAGLLSFLLLALAEGLGFQGLGIPRWPWLLAATLLFLWATVTLLLLPGHFVIPSGIRIAAGALAVAAAGLLLLSLFFELPAVDAYGAGRPALVTSGTYALSRHPGVLWFFLLILGLVLAGASRPLLIALPFWTAADLLLVFLEDRFFFPRLFGQPYLRYRQEVPFLLPTPSSLRRQWPAVTAGIGRLFGSQDPAHHDHLKGADHGERN